MGDRGGKKERVHREGTRKKGQKYIYCELLGPKRNNRSLAGLHLERGQRKSTAF